jgi:hypothetical protein
MQPELILHGVACPPCPPAGEPAALLIWIEQRHLMVGRHPRRRWHLDAFWSRIAELRRLRTELAAEILADPAWACRIDALAAAFALDLAGLDRPAQIEAVAAACLPMRFHISAELAHLRQHRRAQEVLAMCY